MGSIFSNTNSSESDTSVTTVNKRAPGFDDLFETICELGRGGFGVVRKVRARYNDQYYAVKEIKKTVSVEDLEQEIKSQMIAGEHPNIVKLINVYNEYAKILIVLEFCELGHLEDFVIIKNRGYVPDDLKLEFMHDMACGLNHLHTKGIIHRDIKPENILLVNGTVRPICKLADFGLAKYLDTSLPTHLGSSGGNTGLISGTFHLMETQIGYMNTYCGTLFFMAPEIKSGHYTKACDIFSLGAVFYTLLTTSASNGHLMPLINDKCLNDKSITDKDVEKAIMKHVLNPKELARMLADMLKKDYNNRIVSGQVVKYLQFIKDKRTSSSSWKCVMS